MANIFGKIAVTTAAGLALSLALIDTNPALAAKITYDVEVSVESGDLAKGYFSYDDSTLTGIGEEFLPVLEMKIDLPDLTYTHQSADLDPEVVFFDGEFLGASFADDTISFVPGFSSLDEASFAYNSEELGVGMVPVNYSVRADSPPSEPTPVPEPSTFLGLSILGLGLLLARKKKTASQV